MKASSAAASSRTPYAYAGRDQSRFQDSIGYTLATEGPNTAMGVAGGLQIWPKLQTQPPGPEIVDFDKARYNRAPSDSISSHTGPYHDMPARRRPTLHAAASQPDLHASLRKNSVKTDSALPPPIPHAHRSHKLELSKIFGRHKSKHNLRELKDQHSHTPPPPLQLPPPPPLPVHARPRQGSETSLARPASSSASQRTQATAATVFERNPTDNAKINVRRPPKGIKHWFEGLDESDDDLPEVVTAAEPVSTATFRPALGPGRSRVAPTSRVSPACDPPSADYFHFQAASQHQNYTHAPNLQERSMLNLSSDDEDDDQSEPPSPGRWTDRSTDTTAPTPTTDSMSWSKVNDTRQSTFSMQTTMTSGSIPIINADNLEMAYRTPLPPLPAQYQPFVDASAVPAPLRKQKSFASPPSGRARAKSSTSTMASGTSAASSRGQSHYMSVTQEEMALLEMMRRKRAEMQSQITHPARRHDHDRSRRVSPFERHNSVAKSTASSTLSHASNMSLGLMLDSPEGTAFPAPPSSRIIHETENMNYFALDDKSVNTRSSSISTPHSSMLAELEAPTEQLAAVCFEKPRKHTRHDSQSRQVPFHNTADPYSLAPDLELSSIDLLPLPARTYSPSLAGTCSSAMTPEFGNHVTGFTVADSEHGSDGDRHRHSVKSVDSADIDVLTAWGRLGGQ